MPVTKKIQTLHKVPVNGAFLLPVLNSVTPQNKANQNEAIKVTSHLHRPKNRFFLFGKI